MQRCKISKNWADGDDDEKNSLYLSHFLMDWAEILHDDSLDGIGRVYSKKTFLAAASCLYTLLCQLVCLS